MQVQYRTLKLESQDVITLIVRLNHIKMVLEELLEEWKETLQ